MKLTVLFVAGVVALASAPALAQSSSFKPAPSGPTEQGVQPNPAMRAPASMQLPDPMKIADERLAEAKIGLKLTAAQEKSWPGIETAVRSLYQVQADQMKAMLERARPGHAPLDPFEAVGLRADAMSATAAAMKAVVTASKPLAETMTIDQRIRLADLGNLRMVRPRAPGPVTAPVAAGQAPQTIAPAAPAKP
jgi:LTXXQ motif family protein